MGSIIDITNGSGSIVQHYAYSSFGKLLKISDASGNDVTAAPPVKTSYGFTNREHDEESGMMYYRARYYMPEIGRFIQEDPHPGQISYPSTVINRYIYGNNNPVNLIDPTGRSWLSEFTKLDFNLEDVLKDFGKSLENLVKSEEFKDLVVIALIIYSGGAYFGWSAAFWASTGVAAITSELQPGGFADNFKGNLIKSYVLLAGAEYAQANWFSKADYEFFQVQDIAITNQIYDVYRLTIDKYGGHEVFP